MKISAIDLTKQTLNNEGVNKVLMASSYNTGILFRISHFDFPISTMYLQIA